MSSKLDSHLSIQHSRSHNRRITSDLRPAWATERPCQTKSHNLLRKCSQPPFASVLQGLFQGILCPQIQSHAWEEPSHLSWGEGTCGAWAIGCQPCCLPFMSISSAGLLSLDFEGRLGVWGCPRNGRDMLVLKMHSPLADAPPHPQVLLSWSGGPSSSSMVWQVLEVHLHHLLGIGL